MSAYLDDMVLSPGDVVRAVSCISSRHLTEGRLYGVVAHPKVGALGVVNDVSTWIVPSARFERVIK